MFQFFFDDSPQSLKQFRAVGVVAVSVTWFREMLLLLLLLEIQPRLL